MRTSEVVLDRCERDGKQVVCTIHDVAPMFSPDEVLYAGHLRGLADRKIALITLTEEAAGALRIALGDEHPVTVLPHGYVLPLHDPRWQPHHDAVSPAAR